MSEIETLKKELEATREYAKKMDEKATLLSNAKIFAESKKQQAEDSLMAVRYQRNRLLEQEADIAVENLQLKRKMKENAEEFEKKLNEQSRDLDSVRKKFGEIQFAKKNLQAENEKLSEEHAYMCNALEWLCSQIGSKSIKKLQTLFYKDINVEKILQEYEKSKHVGTSEVEELPNIEKTENYSDYKN